MPRAVCQKRDKNAENRNPGQGPTQRTEHRTALRGGHPRRRKQTQTHLARRGLPAGSALPARRRHPAGRGDGRRRPGHRGAERSGGERIPRRAGDGSRVRELPHLAGRGTHGGIRRAAIISAASASPPPTPTSSRGSSPKRASTPKYTPSRARWRSPRRSGCPTRSSTSYRRAARSSRTGWSKSRRSFIPKRC